MFREPDFELPLYFHTTGVGNETEASTLVGLLRENGLFSSFQKFGLGNISGDLSWSSLYSHKLPLIFLTAWENGENIRRTSYGIDEYALTDIARQEEIEQVSKQLKKLDEVHPGSNYYTNILEDTVHWKYKIQGEQLKWGIVLPAEGLESDLYRIWQDIYRSSESHPYTYNADRFVIRLSNLLLDNNVIYRRKESGNIVQELIDSVEITQKRIIKESHDMNTIEFVCYEQAEELTPAKKFIS